MLTALARFIRWITTKAAMAVVILAVAIGGCLGWLYLRNNLDFEQWRQDTVRAITGERARYESALADVNHRLTELSAAITTDQDQLKLADKVVAELKALDSTWDRVFGDREQQKINEGRLASVTARRAALQHDLEEKQQAFTHATWERDGLQVAIGKQDARLKAFEAKRSAIARYAAWVWNYPIGRGYLRMPVKHWIYLVLGLYFLGPSVGRLVLYFVLAPFVTRGRGVRIARTAGTALPEVGESQAAAEITLRAGERLWIKEKFLQASDEGLRRRTRYVLDWRLPFTCLATGLVELIEMANVGAAPAPSPTANAGTAPSAGWSPDATAAAEQQLTLSNQSDPHSELAIVTLPPGASLVLRPSYLAGVALQDGQALEIRRHWQLFRWQAWVTLQFRFFEFVGPCRLIVAGSRGIRIENLSTRPTGALPARRTNQDATIGFTPDLEYRPVRAETFWSYYRGMNPLFDDLFAGRGVFLCQQVATEGEAKRARRFWSTLWTAVMKGFGM